MGTNTGEDGLIALFLELFNSFISTYSDTEFDLDATAFQGGKLGTDNITRQPVMWNSNGKHAAENRQSLENGALIALVGKFIGYRHTGWAGTDNSNLAAIGQGAFSGTRTIAPTAPIVPSQAR